MRTAPCNQNNVCQWDIEYYNTWVKPVSTLKCFRLHRLSLQVDFPYNVFYYTHFMSGLITARLSEFICFSIVELLISISLCQTKFPISLQNASASQDSVKRACINGSLFLFPTWVKRRLKHNFQPGKEDYVERISFQNIYYYVQTFQALMDFERSSYLQFTCMYV